MSIDRQPRWSKAATVYVLVVAAVTIAAEATHNGRFYLLALLLTLPVGVVAVVGVYVAYGLLVQVVSALSPGIGSDQVSERTLAVTAPINVVLFCAAAIANVLVLRRFWARRRSAAS